MRHSRLKYLFLLIVILASWNRPLLGRASFHLDFGKTLQIEEVEWIRDIPEIDGLYFGENTEQSVPQGQPCEGEISSEYGWRRLSGQGRMHEGIDIATPVGTPVQASAAGKVGFAGMMRGYGLTVILEHEDGVQTLFAHNSRLFVQTGDQVKNGQEISLSGNTGHSTGPHLHYEVHQDGLTLDPEKFL